MADSDESGDRRVVLLVPKGAYNEFRDRAKAEGLTVGQALRRLLLLSLRDGEAS